MMSKITYLLKIFFVAVFTSLLYFVIDYFLSLTIRNIDLGVVDLLCYLGVTEALNILISITISGYIANQLIAYFRT